MPISLLPNGDIRIQAQAAVDDVWARVARLIEPDQQPREHARLVYNALWLAFRQPCDSEALPDRLLTRFFER